MRIINLYFDSRDAKLYKEVLARQGEHLASTLVMEIPDELKGHKYVAIFELSNGTPVYTQELIPVGSSITYVLDKGLTSQVGDLKIELQAYEDVDAENKRVIKSAVTRIKIYNALLPVAEVMPEDYVPWYADVTVKTELATQKALEASTYANNARISAEGIVVQEDARASAETERVANELVRVAEEDEREDAENARVILESNRVTAEANRVNAESLRVSSESSRTNAEALRVIAEANRKDGVDGKDGINGTNGADGKDGYAPIKGVDYFDGQKGENGDRGDTGLTGATGSTGEKGDRGEVGERGEQGIQGIPGESGYIHPTTPGNKHIPSGGTVGQILKNTADGEVAWSDNSGGDSGVIKMYSDGTGLTAFALDNGSTRPVALGTRAVDLSYTTVNTLGATGSRSFATGMKTTASGSASHAEGFSTIASGSYSHAEGNTTKATNSDTHAEGNSTQATGVFSHAEGIRSIASGTVSHAEGGDTVASGVASHSQNSGTIAQGFAQTAVGLYNIAQGTMDSKISTDHAFIVGNGADASNRNNAFTIDWYGNIDIPTGTDLRIGGIGVNSIKTATLTTTWVGTSAPYTQTVTVDGVKATHIPMIGDVPTGTNAEKIAQKQAWNMVSEFDTADGSITFTCFEEKPTVAINIQIKGV